MNENPYVNGSLGPVLLMAGILIVLISPRKLKTLGRMAIMFFALLIGLFLVSALLSAGKGPGDPEMFGALTFQLALGAADAVGALHIRSLKRSRPTAEANPKK